MIEEKPSIKIKKAISKLQSDYLKLERNDLTEEIFKENNSFILDTYPTLASKVKDNTIDMEIINHMLINLDNMQDGVKTEHQASVDVGTLLRDKIVIPDMKKRGMNVNTNSDVTNMSEEEAKKKVEKMFQL